MAAPTPELRDVRKSSTLESSIALTAEAVPTVLESSTTRIFVHEGRNGGYDFAHKSLLIVRWNDYMDGKTLIQGASGGQASGEWCKTRFNTLWRNQVRRRGRCAGAQFDLAEGRPD